MKPIVPVTAWLVLGSALFAAEPPSALSLADCLKLAAARQPAIAAAQAEVAGAKQAVGEARAPYYPRLDLDAGYHRWQRRAFLPSGLSLPGHPIPNVIGPLDDWNGGVTSSVVLYDFGARRSALDGAKARAAGAEADARATQADVRLEVEDAFYALAAARDLAGVARKNLIRTEAHRRLAVARWDAGAVPQADVLRLDAELANAHLEVIAAESRVRIAAGRLNTAMGRPAETPLAINPAVPVRPPPTRAEAMQAQARLQVRNEVWAAGAELERAWASIAANEAGVRASTESLRIVRERYERGAALVTDLLDTQTALAHAESSLAAAKWSYFAARAAFDQAVGAP